MAKPLTRTDIIAERCGVRPLALKGGGSSDRDWLQLSRKHAIDVDRERAHISIFGGKLTDCINVGEEICEHIAELGVALPAQAANTPWYGEPGAGEKQRFIEQARALHIDSYTVATAQEPLSERLWRRYGAQAFTLLEQIRHDRAQAEPAIDGLEFIRAELALSAEREMIVTLDDFLRRRSKAALLLSKAQLRDAAGMLEACEILFGKAQAQRKFDDYFQTNNADSDRAAAMSRWTSR